MRKYIIVPEEKYQEFLATVSEPIHEGNMKSAQGRAVDIVDAANESEPGVQHSVVILEYAGALKPEIKRTVKTNFETGRTIVRRDPEVIAREKAEKAKKQAEGPRKRGRKPTKK